MKKLTVLSALLLGVALLAAACGGTTPVAAPPVQATTAPSTPVVVKETVVVQETVVVPATAAPTTAATAAPPAPTPVVQAPADSLTQKGRLTICTDFPYPPQEFFDDNGNPVGMDVDLGTEIASRLGLKVQFVNSVFDTIIAAAKGGKCDIIISAQNITTDRRKAISMIPYFQAGQSMVVAKGNPKGIKVPTDLCGQNAAAETGTTEADFLQATGDYKGAGLPADCAKLGKPAPKAVLTQKDSDALQQLVADKVEVYFADSPVAAYYTVKQPDQFEVAGEIVEPALEGISVACAQEDCTKAPLTPLGEAVKAAFKSMVDDGTYVKILSKWNLQNSALKPDQLNQ
ncbi:MAG: ABC transporter substrate-binding protein [Rudaea sp.]